MTQLTVESLWLSDRASERGIRRSEVRFLIRIKNFSLSHARDKTKNHLSLCFDLSHISITCSLGKFQLSYKYDLFAGTFASQNFQSCEFKCCRYDTLIIILKDVFRLITSVGQRKNSESPFTELKTYHLCGSVVEHRSAESDGLRFDSSWELRIFSLSHARGEKNLSLLLFNTHKGTQKPVNDYKKTVLV